MQYFTKPEPAPERRWITARDARRLIRDRTGDLYPERVVKGLAEAGLLEARAKVMTVEASGPVRRPERFQDVLVPVWFWAECCKVDRHHWDWAAGTFRGRGIAGLATVAVELLLVEFDAAQLDAHFPDPRSREMEEESEGKGLPLSGAVVQDFVNKFANDLMRQTMSEAKLKAMLLALYPDKSLSRQRLRDAIQAAAPHRPQGRPKKSPEH